GAALPAHVRDLVLHLGADGALGASASRSRRRPHLPRADFRQLLARGAGIAPTPARDRRPGAGAARGRASPGEQARDADAAHRRPAARARQRSLQAPPPRRGRPLPASRLRLGPLPPPLRPPPDPPPPPRPPPPTPPPRAA